VLMCGPGYRWDTRLNKCIPVACPAGQEWSEYSGRCLTKNVDAQGVQPCPAQHRWDTRLKRCIPQLCPKGQVFNNAANACVGVDYVNSYLPTDSFLKLLSGSEQSDVGAPTPAPIFRPQFQRKTPAPPPPPNVPQYQHAPIASGPAVLCAARQFPVHTGDTINLLLPSMASYGGIAPTIRIGSRTFPGTLLPAELTALGWSGDQNQTQWVYHGHNTTLLNGLRKPVWVAPGASYHYFRRNGVWMLAVDRNVVGEVAWFGPSYNLTGEMAVPSRDSFERVNTGAGHWLTDVCAAPSFSYSPAQR
jgi:hypothetical protein